MIKTVPSQTAPELVQAMSEGVHNEVRDNRGMSAGEAAQQGDVYIIKVKKHADLYKICPKLRGWKAAIPQGLITKERQVAPGSSIGSRHIVEGSVTMYAPHQKAMEFEGPTLVAKEEWTLAHPEHANHTFGPGTYVFVFQEDIKTSRRVSD